MNRKQNTYDLAGFTLVEMLISVTLVLLMMTMFASIFSMATESMSRQKGLAELDQAARVLTNNIKADFAKRTFRFALPYHPGEIPATSATPFGNRSGYIYISTNDPESGLDDIIQFTANSEITDEEADTTPFLGAGAMLYDIVSDPANANEVRLANLQSNYNQPETDDGELRPNGVLASTAAEITYFVRENGLYRRQMLLRDPLDAAGGDDAVTPISRPGGNPMFLSETDMSTTDTGGRFWAITIPSAMNFDDPSNPNHFALDVGEDAPTSWGVVESNDFWAQFDLSAVPMTDTSGNLSQGIQLIGVSDLANDGPFSSLGNPAFRFGFNFFNGRSREHTNSSGAQFLGRFLSAETSDWRFNWPMANSQEEPDSTTFTGAFIGDSGDAQFGNPMSVTGVPVTLNTYGIATNFDGTVSATDAFGRGGTRAVEDLVLPNVHEFRVELWDQRLGEYVVPGYGTVAPSATQRIGDYHIRRNLQRDTGGTGSIYNLGPLAPYTASDTDRTQHPHVFDTWHPGLGVDARYNYDGDASNDELYEVSPPYIPYLFTPPVFPTGPTSELIAGPAGSEQRSIRILTGQGPQRTIGTNQGYLTLSTATAPSSYVEGDVVFLPWTDVPQPDPVNLGFFLPVDNEFQYNEIPSPGFQIGYRCITAGDADLIPPANWPITPGERVTHGTAQWEAFDNRQPLKSVRLTLRFQDNKTDQMRELALVIPITNDQD